MAQPFAPGVETQGPAYYTIEDLGELNGSPVVPRAINSAGHVVGWFVKGEGANGAFLYTTGPLPTELPSGEVTPVDATAINDSGIVVGVGKNGAGQTVAFRYASAGTTADLGVLSADDPASYAYGVNTGGAAVGYSGDFTSRAVLFPVDAAPADLGVLSEGATSYGYGLNDAGTVAGCATDANGYQRAFVKRTSEALERPRHLWRRDQLRPGHQHRGQITGWPRGPTDTPRRSCIRQERARSSRVSEN